VYRTTYMFSATMPVSVERLARKYMRNPAVVNIGNAGKAADLITQTVIMTKDNQKMELYGPHARPPYSEAFDANRTKRDAGGRSAHARGGGGTHTMQCECALMQRTVIGTLLFLSLTQPSVSSLSNSHSPPGLDSGRRLESLMYSMGDQDTSIIFVNAKKSCDYVARQCDQMGMAATVLHSGKTQEQRQASLAGFKDKTFKVRGEGDRVTLRARWVTLRPPTVTNTADFLALSAPPEQPECRSSRRV
jgi:superfamily II DNA/RNA helicase